MKTKTILLSLLAVVLAIACKKNTTTPVTTGTYLSKETSSLGTFTYNYDVQNRLQSVVFVSSNEAINPSSTLTVTSYDAQNRLVDALTDYTSPTQIDFRETTTYDANGNVLSKRYYNNTTGVLLNGSQIADYSVPNEVKVSYYNASNVLTSYTVYKYDGNNRAEYRNYNTAGTQISAVVYSDYDGNKAPYTLWHTGYTVAPVSKNNVGTQKVTNSTGVTTTYTYTYEYNADGYATKRTSASGAVSTYEYIKR